LGLLLPAMSRAGERFWSHPRLAELYPRYLVAVHTIIRASVPLMAEALAVVRESYLDAPVGPALADYLIKHIPEETGHDGWLLEDLERLGLPREVATEHIPSPAVAAMVGAQYYYIRHYHPAVLLGYIAVLEGYPPQVELAQWAALATGFPIEAFRTLRKHAHLDIRHRQDLDDAFDAMAIDERLHGLIRANALQTLDRLVQVMDEVLGDSVSSRLTLDLVA
jgi:heme oxygenase-like protein